MKVTAKLGFTPVVAGSKVERSTALFKVMARSIQPVMLEPEESLTVRVAEYTGGPVPVTPVRVKELQALMAFGLAVHAIRGTIVDPLKVTPVAAALVQLLVPSIMLSR